VTGTPETYFVDRRGRLVGAHILGRIDKAQNRELFPAEPRGRRATVVKPAAICAVLAAALVATSSAAAACDKPKTSLPRSRAR
jgi:hypothetical protein